jgi:hypothetical protein
VYHIESSPSQKENFGRGGVAWLGKRRMRATQPTRPKPAHHNRSSAHGSADFGSISGQFDVSEVIGTRLNKAAGNVTICVTRVWRAAPNV